MEYARANCYIGQLFVKYLKLLRVMCVVPKCTVLFNREGNGVARLELIGCALV
jgi:hypothetical protein